MKWFKNVTKLQVSMSLGLLTGIVLTFLSIILSGDHITTDFPPGKGQEYIFLQVDYSQLQHSMQNPKFNQFYIAAYQKTKADYIQFYCRALDLSGNEFEAFNISDKIPASYYNPDNDTKSIRRFQLILDKPILAQLPAFNPQISQVIGFKPVYFETGDKFWNYSIFY